MAIALSNYNSYYKQSNNNLEEEILPRDQYVK